MNSDRERKLDARRSGCFEALSGLRAWNSRARRILITLSLCAARWVFAANAEGLSRPPGDVAAPAHWAYQPIRVVTPSMERVSGIDGANAIDAFVEVSRRERGLAASLPADRRTLIRRLAFDLLGLPPSPAEVEGFVRDPSPYAYERLVDRYLASPHYGERWARHWLDAVRYTESQGFEYDRLRDRAWHYRDYVIASLNADKPYDRFMMEQVAGDVLSPVTRDGIVATSLLVCGPWDEAGSNQANLTQRAATREEEMEDLVGVVGQTFLGLTVNCARCHAHKFDPMPQADYFRIKAVFDGVKHGEREIEGEDQIRAREGRRAVLMREQAEAERAMAELDEVAWERWARQTPHADRDADLPRARWRWTFQDAASVAIREGRLHGKARIENGVLILPGEGAWFESAPLGESLMEKTLEAWVALDDLEQGGGAAISVQTPDGRAFDAIVFGERQPRRWMVGSDGFSRTRDLGQPVEMSAPSEWIHMVAVHAADGTVALYRNGVPYGAAYRPESPVLRHAAGQARVALGLRHTGGGRPWLRGRIQSAAVFQRALSEAEVSRLYRAGVQVPAESQLGALFSDEEKAARRAAQERRETVGRELAALPAPERSYAGTRVQPAPTRRLVRGDVTQPAEEVAPMGLALLVGLDADLGLAADAPEGERRLRFARWLADARNPLPARVMMNRLWHHHFGQGLVGTLNDFGVAGARPSHPELLDWLARQFIDSGWSLKAMHRLMVRSATYRQSSVARAEAMKTDADNQWLWRYAPRRLEAEALRDAMLAASGQMNAAMGGASMRPFEVLSFPANAYQPVDRDGVEYNRRTVYRMNVNSGKEPLLDAFDCPDPAVKTPKRGVTTTPLQALALMNGSFVQRQAAHLSRRATEASPKDLHGALREAYLLTLGRPPQAAELDRALNAARSRGLASVCWALLNSTEFVYVQ